MFSHPDVAVLVSRGNGEYFAQLRGSKDWVHLVKRSKLSGEVENGFSGRASSGPRDPIVDFALLKSSEIQARLSDITYVEIQSGSRASEGIRLVVAPRPPPGATKMSLQLDGYSLEGFSHGNRVLVNWKSLPSDVRANPDRLALALKRHTAPDPSPLVHNLESQSYSEIANKITRDPKSFRSYLNDYIEFHFKRNSELFRQKRLQELRQEIQTQQRRVGDVPEFRLQKALLDLEEGKTATVPRTLESTRTQAFKKSNGFMDELEARLSDPNISPQKRANLQTMMDYVQVSKGRDVTARWTIEHNDGRLLLGYAREELKVSKYTIGSESEGRIRAIYAEDSPRLNVADWTPSNAFTRLRDWAQADRVEIRQVQDVQLATFRPSMLIETKTGTKYRLVNSGTASNAGRAARTQCDQTGSADHNGQDHCVAVLIRPKPGTMRPAA